MCTTRGERRLISIRCQKECVESKLVMFCRMVHDLVKIYQVVQDDFDKLTMDPDGRTHTAIIVWSNFWQSFVLGLHTSGQKILKCISKHFWIKIYHVLQELWAFSLTDHDPPDWCSAKLRPSKMAGTACHGSGQTILTSIHVPCSSRVVSIFTNSC